MRDGVAVPRRSPARTAYSCDPEPLIQAIWSLERADDAGSLMPLAAGRG